jgi:hypothetical protein
MQPYAEVVGEWDEVNVRLRAYYDIGLDRLRVVRDNAPANGPPSWASRWYLFDGLGSTRALVDDSGIVQDGYRYDAFGTPTTLAGGKDRFPPERLLEEWKWCPGSPKPGLHRPIPP